MNWVTTHELNRRIEQLRDVGGVVVFVNCAEIKSRSSLDAVMRRSIPLDPRIDGAVPNGTRFRTRFSVGLSKWG
jgi:hypothetical protein